MSLALVLAAAAAAAGQDLTICADRPGKASATCTVPAGHWQLETGLVDWARATNRDERETSTAIGETTVKFGLSDHSDIEIDVTPWQRIAHRSGGSLDSASGFGDTVVLYKHRLTASDSALQLSVYPFVKAPTASRALGNGKWEGGLLVPIGYSIADSRFTIGATPELDWLADFDGHGRHAAMAQAASLGWQATSRLNVSAEIWGQWDWDPHGAHKQASADVSATYLATNRVQLDAGANFGLNRATPDVELYAGASILF